MSNPVVARETIAESIQVGNPASLGWRALTALRELGGTAVAASDVEIIEAQALTATLAGIFAEPAAATSVAVAKKLRADGTIRAGEGPANKAADENAKVCWSLQNSVLAH